MGYNTACIILNDTLHELAKNPDAGRSIEATVLTAGYRDRRHAHYTQGFDALPSQHADTVQVVAVGGNTIQALGYGHWRDGPEDLLRKLADQMGFRLVRKPAKREAAVPRAAQVLDAASGMHQEYGAAPQQEQGEG